VIELILELSQRCRVVALKGNHEELFLNFLEQPASVGAGLFILNGGDATLASYGANANEDNSHESKDGSGAFEIPESHLQFLHSLKLCFETDTHFFVHAGVPLQPLKSLDPKENERHFLWTRQPFLSTDYRWEKIVVHGHTPGKSYEVLPNRINLDSGCVYGRTLTALELPAMRFHQVWRDQSQLAEPIPAATNSQSRAVRSVLRFAGRIPLAIKLADGRIEKLEALNFNRTGILMRELNQSKEALIQVGDHVSGQIGDSGTTQISFSGEVVRSEGRDGHFMYGVRIQQISEDRDGYSWIEKPAK
jgi:serine/threonine protein phosphatase 1